jgi:hypothetical protein
MTPSAKAKTPKKVSEVAVRNAFYRAQKPAFRFDAGEIRALLGNADKARVLRLRDAFVAYLSANLTTTIEGRSGLADYRVNPYVMLTSAGIMGLRDVKQLARFLFDTKFYAGLETSFGKQVESQMVTIYPIGAVAPYTWEDPIEKQAEAKGLADLDDEEKAARRTESVWREIDKSCVVGDRRYLMTIKSGPSCINDSQVQAMQAAIRTHYRSWLKSTQENYSGVKGLDVIIGVTYGTRATTNNKENQILVKLRGEEFQEIDRAADPGVLIDTATRSVRVYRAVGVDFWSIIGDPSAPANARHTFLEVLLGLAMAVSATTAKKAILDTVQTKVIELSDALRDIALSLSRDAFPEWAQSELQDHEIAWLEAAMSAFFDEGI